MLSIIVTWKNRKELAQALPSLLASAQLLNGELLVVNFDGDQEALTQALGDHIDQVRVIQVNDQQLFNKAGANNVGAGNAAFPYLFFCDCDIIVEPESIKTLFEQVSSSPQNFGTLAGVKETVINAIQNNHIISFGYELTIKTQDGRVLKIIDAEEDANDGTRMAPGLLMTSKANFIKINGYNGTLVGWGWEDQDMIGRHTLGAGLERVQHGKALHISHNDEERTKHYPIANRWESRDKMFRQALANYDAENFQGTFKEDLVRFQHQEWKR